MSIFHPNWLLISWNRKKNSWKEETFGCILLKKTLQGFNKYLVFTFQISIFALNGLHWPSTFEMVWLIQKLILGYTVCQSNINSSGIPSIMGYTDYKYYHRTMKVKSKKNRKKKIIHKILHSLPSCWWNKCHYGSLYWFTSCILSDNISGLGTN